ncbi:hypothetical protein ACI2LJ_30300 [Streptomyces sp. NPDC088090]|uniref:hypothetical protein n=1 Tax=Streptomyces sp. NPDC088090 TaxID=3365822 RepID=UPI00384C8C98
MGLTLGHPTTSQVITSAFSIVAIGACMLTATQTSRHIAAIRYRAHGVYLEAKVAVLEERVNVVAARLRRADDARTALFIPRRKLQPSEVATREQMSVEIRALSSELHTCMRQLLAARDALLVHQQTTIDQVSPVILRALQWRSFLTATRLSSGLTSLAVALAGRRRSDAQVQWRDHLEGAPEDGITVKPAMRVLHSFGFIVAALRYRLSDLAAPGWRVIDWVLARNSRTNSVTALGVGSHVIYIVGEHGLEILLTEGLSWLAGSGACLVGLQLWLRRVRNITPADARQAEE